MSPGPSQGELTVGPRPYPHTCPRGVLLLPVQVRRQVREIHTQEVSRKHLTALTDHWAGVHVPFPTVGVPGIPSYLFSNKARLESENWGVTLSPRPGLGWVPTFQFPPAVSHLSRLDR